MANHFIIINMQDITFVGFMSYIISLSVQNFIIRFDEYWWIRILYNYLSQTSYVFGREGGREGGRLSSRMWQLESTDGKDDQITNKLSLK